LANTSAGQDPQTINPAKVITQPPPQPSVTSHCYIVKGAKELEEKLGQIWENQFYLPAGVLLGLKDLPRKKEPERGKKRARMAR
jgi:hypothetical protein